MLKRVSRGRSRPADLRGWNGARWAGVSLIAGSFVGLAVAPTPLTAQSDEAVRVMHKATVRILCDNTPYASGFIVAGGSHVVTNHHALCPAGTTTTTVQGLMPPEQLSAVRRVGATVTWSSERLDLAVLELRSGLQSPSLVFGAVEQVRATDEVFVAGFPGGADKYTVGPDRPQWYYPRITKGVISVVSADVTGRRLLQYDAATNPGSSGGPAFDPCGQVIGVHAMGVPPVILVDGQLRKFATGTNFSIHVGHLLPVLDSLGLTYEQASEPCRNTASDFEAAIREVERQAANVARAYRDSVGTQLDSISSAVRVGQRNAIMLGAMSVLLALLALTRRGRVVVREVGVRAKDMASRRVARQGLPSLATATPLLKGVRGEFAGSSVELGGQPLFIGRHPDVANLVITKGDSGVAKRHCAVRYDQGSRRFLLQVWWSTNGTFLAEGERLEPGEAREIGSGTRFYLADPGIMFEVSHD